MEVNFGLKEEIIYFERAGINNIDIGADTTHIVRPFTSFKFRDLQVREIICKPLYSVPVTSDVIRKASTTNERT